jgi:NTE family protein
MRAREAPSSARLSAYAMAVATSSRERAKTPNAQAGLRPPPGCGPRESTRAPLDAIARRSEQAWGMSRRRLSERRSALTPRRPRTAFVLSGGASLGALQVGMLQALYERGITPDLLVATSVGALNAAFVASRPQNLATARELSRIWRNLQREDIFPVSLGALVGGVCGRRDHLIPDRGLRQVLRRHLELRDLADAAIPLHLVAFDLTEGRELLLSEGPAIDAVAAAASIPGVFPPVEIDHQRLVDGGVVNNTPISHAVELGAERVYVLPTQDPGRLPTRPPQSALDTAMYGLGLLIEARLEADIARYAEEVELIVLPAPNAAGVQPTSFDHSDHLIGQALAAARAHLAEQNVGRHLRLVIAEVG